MALTLWLQYHKTAIWAPAAWSFARLRCSRKSLQSKANILLRTKRRCCRRVFKDNYFRWVHSRINPQVQFRSSGQKKNSRLLRRCPREMRTLAWTLPKPPFCFELCPVGLKLGSWIPSASGHPGHRAARHQAFQPAAFLSAARNPLR